MAVKEIFLNLTKSTMPMGHEHLSEKYLPGGWKKDNQNNYYIKIGDPTVMFTSHLDTADSGQPKEVKHVIEGNMIKTDGKTILGADDKAGAAAMIYMINKGKEGLYYFFHGEERGCQGSNALNRYLNNNKDDELYKKINKIVSLDRKEDYSIITYQAGERCCSDEFAEELAKRLNEAGGFKFRKDPTGMHTDSHVFTEKIPECTNISVGYEDQHTVRESQDIAFLQKLADACIKVDWETLPVKRDPTKKEYSYGRSYTSNRYVGSNWDEERWWTGGRRDYAYSSSDRKTTSEYVTDYLGNRIKTSDAQWCEYDRAWCLKSDAIWVDYVGFYTHPDYDPAKVHKRVSVSGGGDLIRAEEYNIKVGTQLYSENGENFGKISEISSKDITIEAEKGYSFIVPKNKFYDTYEMYIKNSPSEGYGNEILTIKDAKEGMTVFHSTFGEGKILAIRPDNLIARISFKNKGDKDVRIDVAEMKF